MGNCQAAEVATVSIQYPGGEKVERMYWSVSAQDVMSSNPGHYVALVVTARSENGAVVRQLKVLRPAETLAIGYVYRLISFEDVLKELATKKKAKLGKLLEYKKKKKKKKNGNDNDKMDQKEEEDANNDDAGDGDEDEDDELYHQQQQRRRLGVGRYHGGGGQWKPALQSIAENGTLKFN